MSERKKIKTWKDNVIRGQQCIVEEFGLGRVTDFGHEEHSGGYDYIAVRFYADPTHPQNRRFTPTAVKLIDPVSLGKTYYVVPAAKNKVGHTRTPVPASKKFRHVTA